MADESTSFINSKVSNFSDEIRAYLELNIGNTYDLAFQITGDSVVYPPLTTPIKEFHPLILEEIADGSFKISFYYYPGGGAAISTRQWTSDDGVTWVEV